MTHEERALTPLPFAEYLVSRVREAFRVDTVAVLWVCQGSLYYTLPGVDCWGLDRDANKYPGPHPIVAHPPCGPWGQFKWRCFKQSPQDGINAIELVHKYGGVIEQPRGSTLYRDYGRGGIVEHVNQSD